MKQPSEIDPSPELTTARRLTPEATRWISLLMIVASMSVVTAKLADAPVLRSANDRSRWCTVWSIVERGTYQIDEIRQVPGWDTIDKVRHQGHFYSSKPPLLPRLVAEVYRGLKAITGWNLREQTERTIRTILFFVNIVPMAIGLWMFSGLVNRYARDAWCQLFILGCACWGVMLLPFLTVFNNHTVAASMFFMSLPLAANIIIENRQSGWQYVWCGLLTAFGVCNELPAALFGLLLFFLLLRTSIKKTLLLFVPAALVPLVLFFVTNYQATGGWKPFYAYYGTETYEYIHEGVPSYWMEPKGIDKPRDSTPAYLWHCTFGHHGIFSLSPIFLITLAGWCVPSLFWKSRLRPFHLLGIVLTLVTLGFYLTKTENYNYGGVSVSLRWMMWLIPFWLISMLPLLGTLGRKTWFRFLSLAFLGISVFSAWYPDNSPWTQNWVYAWMEKAKWIDYSDPPPRFQRKHYSWISKLPEGESRDSDYWITFRTSDSTGRPMELQLADGGTVEDGKRIILVRKRNHLDEETQIGYLIDPEGFHAEQPVEEFLHARHDGSEITEEDLQFFRGMPRRMQYVGSRIRYEKTGLRTDAVRCHVGYTYVTVDGPDGTKRRIIRDVWFSEEVPFGVLKWEERVLDANSGKLLSRRLWEPVSTGKFFDRAETSEF